MRVAQSRRFFMAARISPCLLLFALGTTWSAEAAAEEKDPSYAHPHEVTGGIAIALWRTYFATTPTARLFDLAYHVRPQRPGFLHTLRSTAGVRIGVAGEEQRVFEVYWRGDIIGAIGAWTPTLGPEFGASTLGMGFQGYPPLPDDQDRLHATKTGPFYMALVMNPLRFSFSRFTVSAFELSIGAPVIGIGFVSRFHVGILNVGGTL